MPRITKAVISAAALSRRRKTFSGGRAANPKPCPYRGDEYSDRAMRGHVPRCPARSVAAQEPRKKGAR